MSNTMTVERKRDEVQSLLNEHNCLAMDIVEQLKRIGKDGQKKLTLLIEANDGQGNSGGV